MLKYTNIVYRLHKITWPVLCISILVNGSTRMTKIDNRDYYLNPILRIEVSNQRDFPLDSSKGSVFPSDAPVVLKIPSIFMRNLFYLV